MGRRRTEKRKGECAAPAQYRFPINFVNVRRALIMSGGVKSEAAAILGRGRIAVTKFINKYPELKAICNELVDFTSDCAIDNIAAPIIGGVAEGYEPERVDGLSKWWLSRMDERFQDKSKTTINQTVEIRVELDDRLRQLREDREKLFTEIDILHSVQRTVAPTNGEVRRDHDSNGDDA